MKTSALLILLGLVAIAASAKLRLVPAKSVMMEDLDEVEESKEEPAFRPVLKRVQQQTPSASKMKKDELDRLAEEQSKNAHYSFGAAIDDGIMDHSHIRQETRDGQRVEGSYAYSDGFFKRTVNYVADEDGYRVVSEHSEPISENGPNVDKNGHAEVHTQIQGVDNQYSVHGRELPRFSKASKKDTRKTAFAFDEEEDD